MGHSSGLNLGLGALPLMTSARTRSISAENPTGEKGRGGMVVPNPDDPDFALSAPASDLGQGWKVRPSIWVRRGEMVTLMDVDGPGVVQHIWMVTGRTWDGAGRGMVLRFYWDDEETPSVEAPLTDFFAVGHDLFAPVNSLAVIVNPTSALNCYWPMPFREHARITITNDREEDVRLFYQITYARDGHTGKRRVLPRPVAARRDGQVAPRAHDSRRRQGPRPVRRGPSWRGRSCRTGGSARGR